MARGVKEVTLNTNLCDGNLFLGGKFLIYLELQKRKSSSETTKRAWLDLKFMTQVTFFSRILYVAFYFLGTSF